MLRGSKRSLESSWSAGEEVSDLIDDLESIKQKLLNENRNNKYIVDGIDLSLLVEWRK